MKHITIIALVALLTVSTYVAHAQKPCSDGGCTDTVLVSQRFNTPDCSGASTVVASTDYTQACIPGSDFNGNSTFLRRCSSAGYSEANYFHTTTCPQNPNAILRTAAVGVCMITGPSSSFISWCNQASISSNFKPAGLAINATRFEQTNSCNVTTGCTNGTGTLTTYSSDDCAAVNATIAGPPSLFVGASLRPGICYIGSFTARDLNVYATCRDGLYTATLSTGGCGPSSTTVTTVSFPTDTCFPFSSGWVKVTCPESTQAPSATGAPSAASALVAGPLAFILAAILFLI